MRPLDDRRNLFDGIKFVLPPFAERKIVAAKFASVFGRLARAVANGFGDFGSRRAAFRGLFAGVFGEANGFHRAAIIFFPKAFRNAARYNFSPAPVWTFGRAERMGRKRAFL